MIYGFSTGNFSVDYQERIIENTVLWENHCHPQYEMIAVVEGRVKLMVEGSGYVIKAGQAIIIHPLAYHTVTAEKNEMYKRIAVLFEHSAIPDVLAEHLLKGGSSASVFNTSVIDELKRVCISEKTGFYSPLLEGLIVRMMYECVECGITNDANNTSEPLLGIISYVETHLTERITLDDIAAHAARSKSSVCHLFRDKMQISLKQYILQKKLALAVKLIRDGVPPTQAALRIGYEDYSDFYRIYRKHINNRPSGEKFSK